MRIVSLLPSATDVVVALGLGDHLVGVSPGCAPPIGTHPAVVVRPLVDGAAEPAEIDRQVSTAAARGSSVYELDEAALGRLSPDLVLTQGLCDVCAVPAADVHGAVETSGVDARVVSLDAHRLEDVLADIRSVGRASARDEEASALVQRLRSRIDAVSEATSDLDAVATFACEWANPPFTAGHWVPDLLELAGGESLLARSGRPSRRTTWEQVRAARPEVVVHMPCGYGLTEAVDEAATLPDVGAARVYAVDADRCFSRPGPQVVDGLEALAWALHPGTAGEPPPGTVTRVDA